MVLESQKRANLEQCMFNLGSSLQPEIVETKSVSASNKELSNFMTISTTNQVCKEWQSNLTLQGINKLPSRSGNYVLLSQTVRCPLGFHLLF